ncbi:hypothetical protein PRUPE_1G418800 [Prunus persica]|uniref:Uncharacterized protein n=1 Tax=Prunus persica TaxID=3760 RepID=A0A251RBB9_PRUPE|nr:hypothetical protein PRUPE_1G418800 [Prunus persica]
MNRAVSGKYKINKLIKIRTWNDCRHNINYTFSPVLYTNNSHEGTHVKNEQPLGHGFWLTYGHSTCFKFQAQYARTFTLNHFLKQANYSLP